MSNKLKKRIIILMVALICMMPSYVNAKAESLYERKEQDVQTENFATVNTVTNSAVTVKRDIMIAVEIVEEFFNKKNDCFSSMLLNPETKYEDIITNLHEAVDGYILDNYSTTYYLYMETKELDAEDPTRGYDNYSAKIDILTVSEQNDEVCLTVCEEKEESFSNHTSGQIMYYNIKMKYQDGWKIYHIYSEDMPYGIGYQEPAEWTKQEKEKLKVLFKSYHDDLVYQKESFVPQELIDYDVPVAITTQMNIIPYDSEVIQKTIDYAKTWAMSYNNNFPQFNADCTNFVSQCLWSGFGGINTSSAVSNLQYPMITNTETRNWYANKINHSSSWTSVGNLYSYIVNDGNSGTRGLYGMEIPNVNQARKGDIIQVWWDSETTTTYTHSIIVGGVTNVGSTNSNNNIFFYSHTGAQNYRPLSILDSLTKKYRVIRILGYVSEEEIVEGWKQDSKGWRYQNANGSYKQNEWFIYNSKRYYFDNSTYCVTGWKQISKNWYYFSSDGVMQTGWQQINGKWYYMNSSGVMQIGWVKVSGNWYYMNSDGVMQTGWQQIDGKWYYFKEDGAMVTGRYLIDGRWNLFDDSGVWQGYDD